MSKEKYQEALDELYDDAINGEPIYVKQKHIKAITEYRDELQELVDKATPMKVLNREQHSKDSDAYGDCPICKTPLCDYSNPKGCGGCLQAIDWSEE